MNMNAEVRKTIEAYLRAVESNLGAVSPAARQEVLSELREHLVESLRRRGEHPTVEDAKAVIASMDPPELFAAVAEPASRPSTRRRSFPVPALLAAVLLAGAGLWGLWVLLNNHPEKDPSAPIAVAPQSQNHLTLQNVSYTLMEADRELMLRLKFNVDPEISALPRFLRLLDSRGKPIEYSLGTSAAGHTVQLLVNEAPEDQLTVVLAQGLPAAGDAAPSIEQKIQVSIQYRFAMLGSNWIQSPSFGNPSVEFWFTEAPDLATALSLIQIEPPVRGVLAPVYGNGLQISGDFQPDHVYTITFRAGMRSVNQRSLGRDETRVVRIPPRDPSLLVGRDGRYLSPRGPLSLPISTMNVSSYVVRAASVLPQNVVYMVQREQQRNRWYWGGPEQAVKDLMGPAQVQTNRLAIRPNTEARATLSLRDLVGPEPRGVYWIEARMLRADGKEQGPQAQCLAVVTDLGLSARLDPDSALVWVNSLQDARSVPNAEVTLYALNNSELARGVTDSNGLVRLSFNSRHPEERPLVVVARSGHDFSFLPLDSVRSIAYPDLPPARAYLKEGWEAYVFSDRGIYRPGETIHVKALVRDRWMEAPSTFPALVRVVRPDGRVYRDMPVQLDEFGAAEATLLLPEFLPTGKYTVSLVLPGTFAELGLTTLALEDFAPPQVRVAVQAGAGRLSAGEPASFKVQADHLFGRPAADLNVSGFASIRPAPFMPEGWKGWRFGDPEKDFKVSYLPAGRQTLDDLGQAEFEIKTSNAWRPPAAVRVGFEATVTEASGRTTSAGDERLVDVYPFYIGLKTDGRSVLRVGETQRVSVVEVAPDGSAWPRAKPLIVRLERVDWNTALRRGDDGRYRWQSEEVKSKILEDTFSASGEPSAYLLVVSQPGNFLLTFSDPDSGTATSFRFFVSSPDHEWVDWSRERPDVVELTLDRDRYRPGETARLMIRAPFSGTALLTIESDRVLDQRVLTLEENTATVELPVLPDYRPNVYCAVTLIRPARAESVWSAHRAAGVVPLVVESTDRRMEVSLEASALSRPQERLAATVHVRDAAGKPAAAAVTIFAVDEAICRLTQFATPDPLAWFSALRALGVQSFDLYSELMPILTEDAGGDRSHPSGDSASPLSRRLNPIKANRFKPVALWAGTVTTDENGDASAEFDVPEFNGQLRLMAVAWNRAQMGAGERAVTVRHHVVAQPSLPRFLAPGDTCRVPVALYSESETDVTVRVRLACSGPLSNQPSEQTVALPPGGAQTVVFQVQASAEPGVALCTLEVESPLETYRDTIELPVRPAAGLAIEADAGVLRPGEQRTFLPPSGWMVSTLRQQIEASSQPAVALGPAIDYLLCYPFGCLEQTTSTAFPWLFLIDQAENLHAAQKLSREEIQQLVRDKIQRVLAMQHAGGGFSLWPLQARADAHWAGIYAVHFLVEAKRAGYAVPADQLAAALDALVARLDSAPPKDADARARELALTEKAYRVRVLAQAGRPDPGWMARLREEAEHLPLAARIHLAVALRAAGEPRAATELLISAGMPEANRARHADQIPSSLVTDAALLLDAWLDVDPQHERVARLARLIEDARRDGHWGTTQDNALALMALGRYVQLAPAPKPVSGKLAVPGGSTLAVTEKQPLLWSATSNNTGSVTLRNDGPGILHYAYHCQGVPTQGTIADEDIGLTVRREWLDLEGNPLPTGSLKQGDLIIVRLSVDTLGRDLDNLILEELLPAGLEIEHAHPAAAPMRPWLKNKEAGVRTRDARDDRLLIFPAQIKQGAFYYAARAVTAGRFIQPAAMLSCMYDPEIRSVSGQGTLDIEP